MWKVEFYTTQSNKSPVTKFIKQLSYVQKARTINVLRLLKEMGPNLRQPYSKKLSGYKDLFELRIVGKSPIRLFYTRSKNTYIILHGFIKKSNKTPKKEIKTAHMRAPS